MDIATHKIYTDICEEDINVNDKLIIVGGKYDREELLVKYITPQWDAEQKGVDHLILYVKNTRNDKRG